MSSTADPYDETGSLVAPDEPGHIPTDVYDQHATGLLRLAHAICQNDEMASRAVAQAFDAAFTDAPRDREQHPRILHLLARLTYLACTLMYPPPTAPTARGPSAADTVTEPQRRALVALTTDGDHTGDEAATLLHINPGAAARVLRTTPPSPAIPIQTSPVRKSEPVSPLTVTVRPGTG